MDEEKLSKIFKLLTSKIPDVDFALLGTLNLEFQGVSVIPRDIDFLTNDRGVKRVSQVFHSVISKDSGYLETLFKIEDIEVHFVSNNFNVVRPKRFMEHTVIVEKYGLKIPCMSLESELRAYKEMGREKDKNTIRLLEGKLSKVQ